LRSHLLFVESQQLTTPRFHPKNIFQTTPGDLRNWSLKANAETLSLYLGMSAALGIRKGHDGDGRNAAPPGMSKNHLNDGYINYFFNW